MNKKTENYQNQVQRKYGGKTIKMANGGMLTPYSASMTNVMANQGADKRPSTYGIIKERKPQINRNVRGRGKRGGYGG